jgi:phosphatidate cytidylyltransferase
MSSHEALRVPPSSAERHSLRDRVSAGLLLIVLFLSAVYLGGWVYFALIALMVGLAATEFAALMRRVGLQPSIALIWGWVALLLLDAQVPAWELLRPGLTFLLLAALIWHLVAYERGLARMPAADWALTLTIGVYLGWTGAHFLLLREHPNGFGWSMVGLGGTALADVGAYVAGRAFGRRAMTPRLSPKKTWEGYLGGLVAGTLGALLLGLAFGIAPQHAAGLGLLVALLTPLGDLGESMIKRQVGAKDASQTIPGHGGVFDRIDSLLWGAVISVYYVQWLVG